MLFSTVGNSHGVLKFTFHSLWTAISHPPSLASYLWSLSARSSIYFVSLFMCQHHRCQHRPEIQFWNNGSSPTLLAGSAAKKHTMLNLMQNSNFLFNFFSRNGKVLGFFLFVLFFAIQWQSEINIRTYLLPYYNCFKGDQNSGPHVRVPLNIRNPQLLELLHSK